MSTSATSRYVVGPADGDSPLKGGLGARQMLRGDRTGERFALVEHPLAPLALGSPVHTHSREDEYSYVLEGRLGVQIGDETLFAGPGDLVLKPRGIPHAFWNGVDEPTRLLEIISPAGFESYFDELGELIPPAVPKPDVAGLDALRTRYGLTMDLDSVGELVERHGLRLG